MKYKTIAFDISSPVTQRIDVPLDSIYGVAVNTEAEVKCGGTSAVGTTSSGYQLFELSSGSEPCTRKVAVEVETPEMLVAEGSDSYDNMLPFLIGNNFKVPLSSFLESDLEVSAPSYVEYVATSQLGPAQNKHDLYIGTTTNTSIQWFWDDSDGKWHSKAQGFPVVDSFILKPSMYMIMHYNVPANTALTVQFSLKLKTGKQEKKTDWHT